MGLPDIKVVTDLYQSLLKIFIESFIQVYEKQCGLKINLGEMKTLAPNTPSAIAVDLVASLSMMSNVFRGSISIGYPQETFLKITSSVLGEEYKEINKDNSDFGAELLNMVFGASKTKYSAVNNIVIQPAIPMLIQGTNVTFALRTDSPTWLIPFHTSMGMIFTTVSMTRNPEAQ